MKEEKETNYKENNKAHLKGDKNPKAGKKRNILTTTTTIGCRDFFLSTTIKVLNKMEHVIIGNTECKRGVELT